ncbi:MAG: ABC transporter permease [Pseudonocardiaceae bacterium]|nr:ABC transporter permease [Pseudonocardiaceae bacterium]
MTTTTATRAPAPTGPAGAGSALAGTGTLVRFMLRRDRIKLPAWLLGITFFVVYYGAALPQLYRTEGDLRAISTFMTGPVGALIAGPGYGVDDPTVERLLVGIYGMYIILPAALMSILLVCRHTRVEEQAGRAELVRASVVGRHAQLTATLIVAAVANMVLALLIGAAMAGNGFDAGDGLLFGASVGAAGLAFAGVTAVTVQVTEYSRAAAGLAGVALGAAYVIRAAGDMLDEGGSALSWLSPIAWSQQTRAYVDGRWWPLALSVAFAAAAAAVGYVLSTRRDVGLGLFAARRGAPGAASWLRSSLTFAFRLQRAGLIGWGAALAAAGAIYGGITEPIVDAVEDLPADVIAVLGGDAANMLDGYLSVMALFDALLVGVFVILGVQLLRSEETKGRAEPVLATATSRWAWFGSHLTVLALGAVGLLVAVGGALGAATAISVGDAGYVGDSVAAHLVYTPALLVLLGVAALLFGVLPRAIGATWGVLGFGLIIGFFGPIMDLPQWVHNLSPLEHIARLPLEQLTWAPMLILTVIAAGLLAIGLYGFRRRDLETK